MKKLNNAEKSHWSKIDHVAFLLMFPFILAIILYPSYIISTGNNSLEYTLITVFGFILLVLWLTALTYDIIEEEKGES